MMVVVARSLCLQLHFYSAVNIGLTKNILGRVPLLSLYSI